MTEPVRPETRENSPPVIVASSVDPSVEPDAAIQFGHVETPLNFSVEVLDLNNPEALEVEWSDEHAAFPFPRKDLSRESTPGETDAQRLFRHFFDPVSVTGCWKVTASVCDGAHLQTARGCFGDAHEATTFWHVCTFEEDPAAECSLEACP